MSWRLRSHSRLSGLTTNYLAFACASYSHASIYPPGLDVDVFTKFCLMSWRLGLTKDWRSLRHIHTVLISQFRAWAWLSLHSFCFIVHIGIASVRSSKKSKHTLLSGEMLFQFKACMHALIMSFPNFGFCMLSETRYLGHGGWLRHKIEEEHKICCIVQ
jgi:hypothetical protein